MKKSLLALAVLGAFAGAASAQSSVTIYGLLDLAITKGNGGNATNPGGSPVVDAVTGDTSKAWIMKQSSSSRLGFRGNEDLGGGLSAQFQIEHRFTPDDGAASNPFWAGRSYIQLTSAAAGSVYMGREYDPAFWPAVKSDPFGWDGVGQISTLQYAGYADTCSGSSVRTSNTLGYKSPNMGGLTAQAAVSLGEGAAGCGRQIGGNVEYAGGPLYIAGGLAKTSGGAATIDGNSLFNFAAHYDLGVVKLIGYFARAKVNGGDDSNKFVQFGLTSPLGGGKLKAAYGRLDPEGEDNNVSKFSFGYDYPLSKRTNVYADVGLARQDDRDNNTAYAFGLKHVF